MTPLWIIVAAGENDVIGGDNRLLWHLRSDLQRFKALTLGKPMVMGRKTFESIGRPLPGRESIVVTRARDFAPAGVHVVHDPAAALALADGLAQRMGAEAIAVVGGGEIYRQLLPHCQRVFLTRVALSPSGDTHFSMPQTGWRLEAEQSFAAGPQDDAPFTTYDYIRA